MKDKKNNEKKQRKNVMLNQSRIDKLTAIGGDNLSKGIRIACDAYKVKKS